MNRWMFAFACALALSGCGAADDDGGNGAAPTIDASPVAADDGGINEESRISRYIRSTSATRLVLEVDSVAGFEPRAVAQEDLIEQLDELLDKPDGIVATADGEIASRGADHAWTDQELFQLADETFDLEVDDQSVKMHVLFVDGHSARDSNGGVILGLAWSNLHLVMFKQTIDDICGGPLTPPLLRERLCEAAEFSIWVHEIGHVLGLVNTGLPMVEDHQDSEHGAHDVNDECVMYWAYEGEAMVDLLRDRFIGGNEDALAFDDECLADIAAIRDAL